MNQKKRSSRVCYRYMKWIRDLGNVFSIEHNPSVFRDIFHMEISTFNSLVKFLWSNNVPRQKRPSLLQSKYSKRKCDTRSIEMIVACGVAYLACQSTIKGLEMILQVPYSSIRKYADVVMHELVNKADAVIFVPKPEKQVFFPDASMKPVNGAVFAVDGTHCNLRFGGKLRNVTYSHKKKHSMNVMVVTDWNMNIVHINSCFAGRCHDSAVWRQSAFFKAINSPNADRVIKRVINLCCLSIDNCYVLADMGYACRDRVVTQHKFHNNNPDKLHFNTIITQARGRVERAIGLLKQRCAVLRIGIHSQKIQQQSIEILACAVLHQFCRYEELKNCCNDEYTSLDHTPDPAYENLDSTQIRNYLTRKWSQGRNANETNTVYL